MPDFLANPIGVRAAAVAVTAAIGCAMVGVLLVVRRQSLMGDAISHAVLPGLAVAFLATGSLGVGPMLVGATCAGLATTLLTETLRSRAGVAADASLGIVYTSLFALGVVLVKRRLQGVHFDVACVYEGSLLQAALDTRQLLGLEVPRALAGSAVVVALVTLVFALFWKELKLASFDAALADTMGFSSSLLHYLLMALVAVASAVAFQSVGAILVVAMMITPAATAELLTDRLAPMVGIAAAVAAATALAGYAAADRWDVSPAGAIATFAGAGYLAAALLAPRSGVVARAWGSLRLSRSVRRDHLLADLYRHAERAPAAPLAAEAAVRAAGGDWLAASELRRLVRRGLVERRGEGLVLTGPGSDLALRVIRSHRLWEAYLVENVGLAEDHVHDAADLVEHYVDGALAAQLARSIADARQDPHGRAIPETDSESRPDPARRGG